MTTVTEAEESPAPSPAVTREQRTDIQALRALAVGSVMLYHLWPNRLTGGFVGVDVFFVISGFLITSHLLGEFERTGRLRPGRFWARRAKRLVPASALVLALTSVAVVVWVPTALHRQYLREIIASTLQYQNWLLAHDSVDYLASSNAPSPTQHFWSLSAEEQFYVALPILILLTALALRVVKVPRRRAVGAVLLAVVCVSLVYSITLTTANPGVAYFSTFTRAWEFGIGALVAAFGVSSARRTGHHVVALLGVAAIVAACVLFDDGTAFPGYAAALPVVGTALVIWGGRASLVERVGAWAPVALLGRVSFAAYLWHWPMIVLLPSITHHALTSPDKVGILVGSIALAWLSTVFVEDPIRFRPRLLGGRRPLVVAAWCGSAMALVVAFAGLTIHRDAEAARQEITANQTLLAQNPRCLGAQALDPTLAPCDNPALHGKLIPGPATADLDDANEAACWTADGAVPNVCSLGPRTGYTKTLLAAGDSHNNTLIGVYRAIATHNNWRIDVTGHGGCYLTDETQQQDSADLTASCAAWRANVLKRANSVGYDAIIVTHSSYDHLVVPSGGRTLEQTTVDGLVGAWKSLPKVPILAIVDNPHLPRSVNICVNLNRDDAARKCDVTRQRGLEDFDGQAEAAKQVPNARVLDFSDFYCTSKRCPPVIGHVLVYRDASHITATYAKTLAPYIDEKVIQALQ